MPTLGIGLFSLPLPTSLSPSAVDQVVEASAAAPCHTGSSPNSPHSTHRSGSGSSSPGKVSQYLYLTSQTIFLQAALMLHAVLHQSSGLVVKGPTPDLSNVPSQLRTARQRL